MRLHQRNKRKEESEVEQTQESFERFREAFADHL